MKRAFLLVAFICAPALAQVTPPPPKPAAYGGAPNDPKRVNAPVSTDTGPNPAAQRLSFAQQAFGLAHSAYRQGNLSADAAATWSLRIYEAQKDKDPTAAKQHLERMLALERFAKERNQQGSAPMLDVLTVSFFRAQAEQLVGKK